MSLINQMLKDLEARRPQPGPAGYVGSPQTQRGPSRQRWLVALLGGGLVLLALLSGWLVWERFAAPSAVAASVPPIAQAAPPETLPTPPATATESPTTPARPSQEQTMAPTTVPTPALSIPVEGGDEMPTPTTRLASPPTAASSPIPSPHSEPVPRTSTPLASAPAEESRIQRRVRPPSPAEQAERDYQQGYLLLQQGEHARGQQLWQQALEGHPPHLASREGLAGLYLNQGQRDKAMALLEEGLNLHPGHGQFAMLLARLQMEGNDLALATRTLEHALNRQVQSADYIAFLAALYQRQQHFEPSINSYQRALSMQPNQSTWWMGLGISLEGAARPSEARQAYQEALQRGGLSPELRDYVQQRLRVVR